MTPFQKALNARLRAEWNQRDKDRIAASRNTCVGDCAKEESNYSDWLRLQKEKRKHKRERELESLPAAEREYRLKLSASIREYYAWKDRALERDKVLAALRERFPVEYATALRLKKIKKLRIPIEQVMFLYCSEINNIVHKKDQ